MAPQPVPCAGNQVLCFPGNPKRLTPFTREAPGKNISKRSDYCTCYFLVLKKGCSVHCCWTKPPSAAWADEDGRYQQQMDTHSSFGFVCRTCGILLPRQRCSCSLFAREKGHVKTFPTEGAPGQPWILSAITWGALFWRWKSWVPILWATCIYTVRMRLEFDNQKANVLILETILGWKKNPKTYLASVKISKLGFERCVWIK